MLEDGQSMLVHLRRIAERALALSRRYPVAARDVALVDVLAWENAHARVEHGAACYRRQNANRPWGE